MLKRFKLRRQYRVTELIQTFDNPYRNTCSFVCNGKKYYGEGENLTGISRILSHKGYMWTIYTETHGRMFNFAMNNANEPISARKLSRWMCEYLEEQKAAK